jgi:glycosyltransferase involved in cell wall biosynthesis
LLIVELVSGPHRPSASQLQQAAQRRGWQVAWIFHDAIPLRLAHLYGARAAITAAHHAAYMRGLAGFQLVLANSCTTAAHLRTFLRHEGLPFGHVYPLPLALEFPGTAPGMPPRPATAHAPKRLLCVGSLEPRKNHRALLKALVVLAAQDRWPAELVLVGWANDRHVVEQVQRALNLGLALQWEPEADDQRLAALYDWCDFTVYPSLEEGFGLPVAESLWKRRPCICSGDGALGELVAGGGCLSVNTTSWRELAAALDHLLHDRALQRELQAQVQQRVLRSWRHYAEELLQNLDQAESNTARQHASV